MKNTFKATSMIAVIYLFTGYQELSAQAKKDSLKEKQIDEVVMIGYGTRKKSDLTSTVTKIASQELEKQKVLNVNQAVQGKAAGVYVVASDSPGSIPSVIIRGLGTALGGREPLYVIDGIQVGSGFVNNINSNDIESYEILKDAVALAIYGNRAANGVIIITTKQGKGKFKIEYDAFVGARTPLKTVKMAGSNLFSYYSNVAEIRTRFSQDQPVNTDWFKAITRTGFYNQNTISLNGSSTNFKYFFSVGNYSESAILKGLGYDRVNLRSNNEVNVNPKFKITQTFGATFTKTTPKPFSAFTNAYKQSPAVPVRFSTGQYGVPYVNANGFVETIGNKFNNVGNPVAELDFFNEKQKNVSLYGNITGEYKIFDNLKFTSQFGGEYNSWKMFKFSDVVGSWLAADPNRRYTDYQKDAKDPTTNKLINPINLLEQGGNDFFNWNWANFLTFNKKIKDIHDVEVTLGTEMSSLGSGDNYRGIRGNVPEFSNYWHFNFATTADFDKFPLEDNKNSYTNEKRLQSFFGRLQYILMGRYLLSAAFRRDGSSQFQKSKQWGSFPSVGLGWIVSKESFMNDSVFDFLKLRGGWGRLGNQNVLLNVQTFSGGNSYAIGGNILNGNTINSQIDPNLEWEVIEELSGGVDFELFSKKLSGSLDIYNKNTNNIILFVSPYKTSGYNVSSPGHVGEVSNKGIETMLKWTDNLGENGKWWIGGNFSYNKNVLEKITNSLFEKVQGGNLGNGQFTKLSQENQPLGSFWLWEADGFDAEGKLKYKDQDNNGILDDKDRIFAGSIIPKYFFGANLGINYKNWDFSVDVYGNAGAKVYNGKKAQRFGNENVEYSVASNFWSPNNTNSPNPVANNDVPIASTYYLESADFIRINNITLGYTLPKFNEGISSFRVYVSSINPFIWQKYSGFTPELNGDGNPNGSQGIELDTYPSLSSFLFGVNIKF